MILISKQKINLNTLSNEIPKFGSKSKPIFKKVKSKEKRVFFILQCHRAQFLRCSTLSLEKPVSGFVTNLHHCWIKWSLRSWLHGIKDVQMHVAHVHEVAFLCTSVYIDVQWEYVWEGGKKKIDKLTETTMYNSRKKLVKNIYCYSYTSSQK